MHAALVESLGPQLYHTQLSEPELNQRVRVVLHEVLTRDDTPLPAAERATLAQQIADEILGYGPLEPFLRDPEVTEVMVNGFDTVYIERGGKIEQVDAAFSDDAHLRRTIDKIVGRVGPPGGRVLAHGGRPAARRLARQRDHPAARRRRRRADDPQVRHRPVHGRRPDRLRDPHPGGGRVPRRVRAGQGQHPGRGRHRRRQDDDAQRAVESFIPEDERIVTIEDAAELQLHQDHVIRLEARPANIEGRGEVTIRDLVKNSLRMRPDRIVVGEVRDAAALDMLQAMNTGHDGSICTVHANTPRDTLARIETMVLMAGVDLPVRAIREQVSSAIDLVVQQARFKDGSRHITHVTEVVGMEGDIITMQDIYKFDYDAGFDAEGHPLGTLVTTGLRPKFLRSSPRAACTSTPPCSRSTGPDHERPDDEMGGRRGGRWRRWAWAPGVAWAAPEGRIQQVESADGAVTYILSAEGLAEGESIDPASVGRRWAAWRRRRPRHPWPTTQDRPCARTTMIVLDSSGSMAEFGKLARPRTPPSSTWPPCPPTCKAGLVTFADKADGRGGPDRGPGRGDRRRSTASKAEGATALNDAVVLTVDELGADGTRNAVLLSDGEDEGSNTSAKAAAKALKKSGVVLDAVSLGTGKQTAQLAAFAKAGNGSVVTATDAGELTAAFESAARTVVTQLAVTADGPQGVEAGTAEIVVAALVGDMPITDSAVAVIAPRLLRQRGAAAPAYGPSS